MKANKKLVRRYVQEWRQTRWQYGLAAAELLLVGLGIAMIGEFYIANAGNFGKPHPAYWGIVAILAAALLLYSFIAQYHALARMVCLLLAVIQLPPVWCWMVFGGPFEFTGVMMVPGWLGLSVHLLFLAWGAVNYMLLTRFLQTKEVQRDKTIRIFGG